MAKKQGTGLSSGILTKKVTSIGDGIHSRPSKNKHSTKKAYRGQGK